MPMRFQRAKPVRWTMRSVNVVLALCLLLGTFGPSGVLLRTDDASAAGPPLYPDLKTTRPSGLYFDRVTMSDDLSHYVLRFSNTVWNDGDGRLELQGDPRPDGSSKVYQNVYDSPSAGTRVSQTHVSSDLVYHPSHYHYHLEGFASYLMLQRDSAGVYQPTTKKGTKTGFCIMDSDRISSRGATSATYGSCDGALQGISVGWGDLYQGSLPEQWIDLGTSRLADGYYAIQSTADPRNKLNEGGRDNNNVGLTYFRVSGGAITIIADPSTPPPTTNPPGTANPSFTGTKAPIVYSGDNPYTGSSFAAYDNDLNTTWFSGRDYQPRATLTVDLGATRDISGVKWKFHSLGYADQFTVAVATETGGTRTLGLYGNAPYAQTFYGVGVTDYVLARYVVFTFTNVNNDASLGSISELEVWANSPPTPTPTPTPPPSNPPGTANPVFAGYKARIATSSDSPNTGSSFAAYDNDLNTTWFSGRDYQPRATLTIDLGATYDISGVKWKFHSLGYADEFTVSVMTESGGTRGLGRFGNAPYAQTFYGVGTGDPVHARYVVFQFTNVDNDASLGSISELEVWARANVSPAHPPGTANPAFAGYKAPITGSTESPNTGTASASYDNDLNTTWFSGRDYQPRATLTIDLGATSDLTGIKWKFHSLGYADEFTVSVMTESGGTRTLGLYGNAPYAQTFYGVGVSDYVLARYVVFSFTNIDNDASLGSISELEVWARGNDPSSAQVSSASADSTATPTLASTSPATPMPETPGTPTPSPTEEPTATPTLTPTSPATPTLIEEPTATPTPTEEPTATVTSTPTLTPTPTVAPTEESTATPSPTEVVETPTELPPTEPPITQTGTIANTGAGGAYCRTDPTPEGEVIVLLDEGTPIGLTGDPVGEWQPVVCNQRPGYVFADFIRLDGESNNQDPSTGENTAPARDETGSQESTSDPVQTAEPTLEPTTAPTPVPVLVQRDVVITAAGDSSVMRSEPDSPQGRETVTSLPVGGESDAVAVLTFEVDGIDEGTVVNARLVLTGTGDTAGAGGNLYSLPGIWLDESSTTWNDVASLGGQNVGWVEWIQPGAETGIDVTGTFTSDGSITFVIEGTPEQMVAIASSESGAPPYLLLTIEAPSDDPAP